MKQLFSLLLSCAAILFFQPLFAQSKPAIKIEDIRDRCKDIPYDKRVRLTVARFTVSVPNAGHAFGGNLTTMLTNALQDVNCFRVLESLRDSSDLVQEISFASSGNANTSTGPKKGKMLGAQVVVTGEITEYNLSSKSLGVGILKTNAQEAHIGFVVKMVNPETREVLYSKTINTDSKVSGGARVGISVTFLGRIDAGSGAMTNPAIADAVSKGIIKAVAFLSDQKDKIPLPTENIEVNNQNTTIVTIANATFPSFTSFGAYLAGIKAIKESDKAFSNGLATFTITHQGTTDDLLQSLSGKMDTYDVVGFSKGRIDLKAK